MEADISNPLLLQAPFLCQCFALRNVPCQSLNVAAKSCPPILKPSSVILAEHSNTERGFLPSMRAAMLERAGAQGLALDIRISATDEDPLCVV